MTTSIFRVRRCALAATLVPTLALAPIGTALAAPASDAVATTRSATVQLMPPRPSVRGYVAPEAAQLKNELRGAITATNEDPDVAAARLAAAIQAATDAPATVARDPDLYGLWVEGMLTLARAHLVLDERDKAVVVIDEAIRVSRGTAPAIESFGPSLTELYRERLTAPELRAVGSIHVSCTSRCRAILDGRTAGTGTDSVVSGIPLGDHVIHIEPLDQPSEDFKLETFTLTDQSRAAEFTYDPPKPKIGARTPTTDPDDPGSGRKVPRWASIVVMSAGAMALIAGGVLYALDGTCPDGADPDGAGRCANTFDTSITGIALMAPGAAALVGFSVVLGVGEVKDKRYKQSKKSGPDQATIGFGWRF